MNQDYIKHRVPTYSDAWQVCKIAAIVCLIISFLLMSGIILKIYNNPLTGDELVYSSIAKSIASGQGYTFHGYWLSEKSPGYSTFLAIFYRITGDSTLLPRIAQMVLHLLVVVLTVLLGYRMTESRWVAWAAGLMASLDLYVSLYHVHILSEGLFDPISLGIILCIDSAFRKGNARFWAFAGILLGLSIYLRPSLYMLPVLFVLIALLQRLPLKKIIIGFTIMGTCAFVVVLPWSIRNYNLYRAFTPLPAYGGTCLNVHVKNAINRSKGLPAQEWSHSKMRASVYKESEAQKKEAIKLILKNPGVFAVSIPAKSFQMWTTAEWNNPNNKKSIILGIIRLFVLMLAVMAFFIRKLDDLFRQLAFASIAYTTLLTALSANPEYRYAFWTYSMYYILVATALHQIVLRFNLIKKEGIEG